VARDLYDVLGVPGTASEAEIRHAFWVLAKKYHPDFNGGDQDAARRFVEVGNAAETLLDPDRRASYDESRALKVPAGTPAAAPKPPAAKPPAPPASARAGLRTGNSPGDGLFVIIFVSVLAIMVTLSIVAAVLHVPDKKKNESVGPVNGSVVWKTTGFGLDDGWGINLAGNGTRIQIFPGESADIEVTGGYLASAGHIALLPHGAALTYQRCVSAVEQGTSQSEPLSEITPAAGSGVCVSGSGGDLASVQVTRDDGTNLTVNITVWEDV
jgi:DnaJ domain